MSMSASRDALEALMADPSWCDDFGEQTLRETARRLLEALRAAAGGVDRVVVEWTKQRCTTCDGTGRWNDDADADLACCQACAGEGWGPEGVQLSAAADRIVELEEALLRARGWVDLAKPGKLRDFDLAYIDRVLGEQ